MTKKTIIILVVILCLPIYCHAFYTAGDYEINSIDWQGNYIVTSGDSERGNHVGEASHWH